MAETEETKTEPRAAAGNETHPNRTTADQTGDPVSTFPLCYLKPIASVCVIIINK